MQISFNQFESELDGTILSRGLRYFENGRVKKVEQLYSGHYEAIVRGSQRYTVQVNMENRSIMDAFCDCPYDTGPVCKHIAAVLYWFQANGLEEMAAVKKGKKQKAVKAKTVAEQVTEILDSISHQELKQFVKITALDDSDFRSLLLATYATQSTDVSKGYYQELVKGIVDSASGYDDYMGWEEAHELNSLIDKLLGTASEKLEKGKLKVSFWIATAVIEELFGLIEEGNDYEGVVGESVSSACNLLGTIAATAPENHKIQSKIFKYALDAVRSQRFNGWDWAGDFLDIAAELVRTEEDFALLLAASPNTRGDDYRSQYFQKVIYEVTRRLKGEDAANEYLEQHLDNNKLRSVAINQAFDRSDFERVIQLAEEGIRLDELNRNPGLVNQWRKWLLKTAQAQNRADNIIVHARQLYFDSHYGEGGYFDLLKKTVTRRDWPAFVENLMADIQKDRYHSGSDRVKDILASEGMVDKLLEQVLRAGKISDLKKYESYLSKKFAPQLVEMYAGHVLENSKSASGRELYKQLAAWLMKMIQLGGRDQALSLAYQLRSQYPSRKAMIDELKMVK